MNNSNSILVTGAIGEVGRALIPELAKKKGNKIIALDIKEIDSDLKGYVKEAAKGSVLNKSLLHALIAKNKISVIYHLASILSTEAEKSPEKAHNVNVGGTANLLEIANHVCYKEDRDIKFIFPSTIAVYGLPNLETKNKTKKVKENEYNNPSTMYGINKLYCEHLGIYYSKNYKMLEASEKKIDFRAVRFPGLISTLTVPTGGTSDYAPELIHTAAQGKTYEAFVRNDTTLPFMVMPDAVKALVQLSEVAKDKLTRNVYNVTSFSAKAKDIENLVMNVFPKTSVSYNPDEMRQKIVDSWPTDTDDSAARNDWEWKPDHDMKSAFEKYLIPEIKKKYKKK